MSGGEGAARKQAYFARIATLLEGYNTIFVVHADFVGSSHMQSIRKSLRATNSVLLMGKNTMIRKAIRGYLPSNPKIESLLPWVFGNIGFVFTHADISAVRKQVVENRVAAAARPGTIAPVDVIVPKGNTGMEPTQTAFLQALNIPSKINKGQVEIINDVHLIQKGQKVGNSEAALLTKLDIKPFSYGLEIKAVYQDGVVMEPSVLDITDDEIVRKFHNGVSAVAAIGLKIGYPTVASLPHSVANGYKNVLAIAVSSAYTFERAAKIKEFIANPELAKAAAAATAPPPAATKAAEKPKEKEKEKPKEKEPEPEEEEEMGMGGLFD
jgi:large subunit ribosomal protein LP0